MLSATSINVIDMIFNGAKSGAPLSHSATQPLKTLSEGLAEQEAHVRTIQHHQHQDHLQHQHQQLRRGHVPSCALDHATC